jgi:hypothetical protein
VVYPARRKMNVTRKGATLHVTGEYRCDLIGLTVNLNELIEATSRRRGWPRTSHFFRDRAGHDRQTPRALRGPGGSAFHEFLSPRVETRRTHGSRCAHSAALTACLALGLPLVEGTVRAKRFLYEAIRANPGLVAGCGPVNHRAEA